MCKKAIKKLSKQLDAAQHILEEIRATAGFDGFPTLASAPEERSKVAYAVAVKSLEARRARISYFGDPQVFGEPAWDMLLELFIQQSQNDDVSVTSASLGSGAPASTTYLWLKLLEERHLVVLEDDPADDRRKLVRLTPEGFESMTRYLNDIAG